MKRWARKFDSCVRCFKTDAKHMAGGLCSRCYSTEYLAAHSVRCKQQKHDWWVRNGGPALSKNQREKRHFDGRRELVIYRDERCQRCGGTNQLLVHHQDGNGRGNPTPNNDPWNLKTLCRKCHMEVHRAELQAARGFVSSTGWAPKYGLDACRNCHRSDRKHNALGLCLHCYTNRKPIAS